ncbi:UDP-N-acetylenolpyruvoylglucosamine reductase [Dorea sp. 5-2]|nr:UDP-N-acetylenolpyruvoylglucosamine reductase [Dorea sp. 5-2]
MEKKIYHKLVQIVGEERVRTDEPMKSHTTFRVGGPADFFVTPETSEEVRAVIDMCRSEEIDCHIIGNGSNLLVSDRGVRGVVVQIAKAMNKIESNGEQIRAQAGALLSEVAAYALKDGLAGFEFAAGIPGTLGGACVMNAGAYGGEMKDVLYEVTVLTPQGEFLVLKEDELELGYRTSVVARKGYIVLEAVIRLKKGDEEEIRRQMEDLRDRRISKQPLEYPSAGSTFKRPEGYFAGKLIQDAGLRGYTFGGAQVSEKHCGFVVNRGDATAAEVAELMRRVADKVEEQFKVRLEPEVKRLGDF